MNDASVAPVCPILRDDCVAVKSADLSGLYARFDSVDRTLRGHNGDPGLVGAVQLLHRTTADLVKSLAEAAEQHTALEARTKAIEIVNAAREPVIDRHGKELDELRGRVNLFAALNALGATIGSVLAGLSGKQP